MNRRREPHRAKRIPLSALKEDAAKVVQEVAQSGEPWTVMEQSRPVAVIVDFETFVAMQRRLGELKKSEETTLSVEQRRKIQKACREWLEETDVYPWELMKHLVGGFHSGRGDLARRSRHYVMEMIRAKAEKRRRGTC
jgi:prevent-host-death family protein